MLRCNAARRLNRNRIEPGNDRASEAVQRQARSIGRHRRQHARVLRLHHLQLLRHPDRPYLLPDGKRVRQPDAVAGDFRRRLRDAADRRNRAWDLFRPDRPAACHAAELRAHGAIDPDHRAHAVLSIDRSCSARHRDRGAYGARLCSGRGGWTDHRLSDGDRPAPASRAGGGLATGQPGDRRDDRRRARRRHPE